MEFARTWAPLPAQMATVRIRMSSTSLVCGIATGKPLGLPTPRAIRSIRCVRGWAVENVTSRPMPEEGWVGTCVIGWMVLRVWDADDLRGGLGTVGFLRGGGLELLLCLGEDLRVE